MARQRISEFIDQHLDAHIGKIQELVRQPSVSLETLGLRECAELVRRHLAEVGCRRRLWSTSAMPIRVSGGSWTAARRRPSCTIRIMMSVRWATRHG